MNANCYTDPNSRVVYVEVKLMEDYKLNDGPQPTHPRLIPYGWFAQEHPAKWRKSYSGEWIGQYGWMEKAVVKDFAGTLPKKLFAIVRCSNRCSWYIDNVFIGEENAYTHMLQSKAEAEKRQADDLYWVELVAKRD